MAYNSHDDKIWVLDIQTGQKTQLTTDEYAYYNPIWSPDNTKILVSTISAQLKVIDVVSRQRYDLDKGRSASWFPDSKTIFYSRTEGSDDAPKTDSDIYYIQYTGTGKMLLTQDAQEYETSVHISPDGKNIAYVSLKSGKVYQAPLLTDTKKIDTIMFSVGMMTNISDDTTPVQKWKGTLSSDQMKFQENSVSKYVETTEQTVQIKGAPYIHQLYDTPVAFDGNWACNASSALMGIAYYGKLNYWGMTGSSPYGRYVSDIYTYNGVTYDINGNRYPGAPSGYGGYGYYWGDPGDRYENLRDYIRNHGLSSDIDAADTWEKLKTEIDNGYPIVTLISNTLTDGHYILAIGYYKEQRTAIFHDPYGNMNSSWPNPNGVEARYDWPGYSNGYRNLGTVYRFIYVRGDHLTIEPIGGINSGIIRIIGGAGWFGNTVGTVSMGVCFAKQGYCATIQPTLTANGWTDSMIELNIFTSGFNVEEFGSPVTFTITRNDGTTVKPITYPFKDVAVNEWYTQYIFDLWKSGVVQGYTDSTYRPEEEISRAEFIKMIVVADNSQCGMTACTDEPFSDVNPSDWFYDYIRAAWKLGWLTYNPQDPRFRPYDKINRAEVAKLLNVARGDDLNYIQRSVFSDITIVSMWYHPYVHKCYDLEIFAGYPEGKNCSNQSTSGRYFCPEKYINRAETAKVIYNAFMRSCVLN